MTLTIHPLKSHQVEAAQSVIIAGCLEFFGHPPTKFEDMADLSQYAPPSGTFLVLVNGEAVVGTGAIRRISDEMCELRRLWFLPESRGQGYGTKMCGLLFDFARATGYKRVRLDTSPLLISANQLYQRLGFQPIERYNDGPGTIFMEKEL